MFAIDILERIIPGDRQTHWSDGGKSRDVVVASAVDHAAWSDQSVAAERALASRRRSDFTNDPRIRYVYTCINANAIDTILISHFHPDQINGIVDTDGQ